MTIDVQNRLSVAAPLKLLQHAGGLQLVAPLPEAAEVVQLTTTLTLGGSAQARVLHYDGATWKQTAQEITVHDVVGSMEGTPGKRGLAWFHRQSGLWILWQLEC